MVVALSQALFVHRWTIRGVDNPGGGSSNKVKMWDGQTVGGENNHTPKKLFEVFILVNIRKDKMFLATMNLVSVEG